MRNVELNIVSRCEIEEKDVYLIDADNPGITNEYVNNGCHTLLQKLRISLSSSHANKGLREKKSFNRRKRAILCRAFREHARIRTQGVPVGLNTKKKIQTGLWLYIERERLVH